MKKTILFAIFFVFLFGCNVLQPAQKQSISTPQITGYKGVEVFFSENLPPSNVFETQLFDIGFRVENQGGSDALNSVYVVGIPSDFQTSDPFYGRFNLKGKSLFYPFGESKYFSLRAQGAEIGPQLERIISGVSIDVCYPYQTKFNSLVCINPDPSAISKSTKVCTPSAQSFSGQGAPVAITKIDAPVILPHENPALIKFQIVLHVQNLGTGFVVSKQKYADACSQKRGQDIFNVVQITGSLEDSPLECRPSILRLNAQDNTIVCTATSGLEKAVGIHQGVLSVNLDYGYFVRKTKQVFVNRALQ